MAGLGVFAKSTMESRDPAPPTLAEARGRRLPPEPRLQAYPEADLIEFQAREEKQLTTYGWVDEDAGVARVPIDRAIDMLLERGGLGPCRGGFVMTIPTRTLML